jgi:hypothetical protein
MAGRIATILLLLVVLSYPPMSVIISQASVVAGRRCFFTLGMLRPISRPVSNGELTTLVSSQRFCCNNLACRFSPLLG